MATHELLGEAKILASPNMPKYSTLESRNPKVVLNHERSELNQSELIATFMDAKMPFHLKEKTACALEQLEISRSKR